MALSLLGMIVWAILGFLSIVQLLISNKILVSGVTTSPLESGFESIKPSLLMSSPFFFLAVLFVLFDLELILIFPAVVTLMSYLYFIVILGGTLVVVLLTLIFEWIWHGLKWQN